MEKIIKLIHKLNFYADLTEICFASLLLCGSMALITALLGELALANALFIAQWVILGIEIVFAICYFVNYFKLKKIDNESY